MRGDAAQPGAEFVVVGQAGQGPEATQQGFLGQVLRLGGVAQPRVADGGDPAGPAAHELLVGLGSPGKRLAHQLAIRHHPSPWTGLSSPRGLIS